MEGRKKETAMLLTHIPPRISVEGRSLKYRNKGKERTKQKDAKKLIVKKMTHHGVSPFAGDEEIIEAEKQYFLKLEAVFKQPDSTSHLTFTKLFPKTLFRLKGSSRNNELFELQLYGPIYSILKDSYCINMKYKLKEMSNDQIIIFDI